ncbi:PREDICTED: bromodomain and WD repeat-containing protein 1-like [Papilio polytes]|uniref:bromodomain and WD repeat-containing protein 1-like n=1 Tax=Papilio polytes TaxID=76194 RepID=UPI000675CA81|nr:PREDICTED: bromodomain and WD repeat-containing protein 1-like [Papilio polytes]
MEESNEEANVVPELYFLIAKFLSGGPLKETAKTLLKELERVEVLPRRLDWEGNEHTQSYDELAAQHNDMSWRRLATVCERALQLASKTALVPNGNTSSAPVVIPPAVASVASAASEPQLRLKARLSLLSESLVRPKPKYATHQPDHSLVRRLC